MGSREVFFSMMGNFGNVAKTARVFTAAKRAERNTTAFDRARMAYT